MDGTSNADNFATFELIVRFGISILHGCGIMFPSITDPCRIRPFFVKVDVNGDVLPRAVKVLPATCVPDGGHDNIRSHFQMGTSMV
jgi:hypothetical protein